MGMELTGWPALLVPRRPPRRALWWRRLVWCALLRRGSLSDEGLLRITRWFVTRNVGMPSLLVLGLGMLTSDRRRARERAWTRHTGWSACRIGCRSREWAPSGAEIAAGHSPLHFGFLCAGSVPSPSSRLRIHLVRSRGFSPPLAAALSRFVFSLRCGVFPAPSPAPFPCDVATTLGHLRMFAPTCVER